MSERPAEPCALITLPYFEGVGFRLWGKPVQRPARQHMLSCSLLCAPLLSMTVGKPVKQILPSQEAATLSHISRIIRCTMYMYHVFLHVSRKIDSKCPWFIQYLSQQLSFRPKCPSWLIWHHYIWPYILIHFEDTTNCWQPALECPRQQHENLPQTASTCSQVSCGPSTLWSLQCCKLRSPHERFII